MLETRLLMVWAQVRAGGIGQKYSIYNLTIIGQAGYFGAYDSAEEGIYSIKRIGGSDEIQD